MNHNAVYRTAPATPGLLNKPDLRLNPAALNTKKSESINKKNEPD